MMVIRPIRESDQKAFEQFAMTAGAGVTSLPKNSILLREKIQRSLASFASSGGQKDGIYVFVLEDTATQQLGGTCTIDASTLGSEDGFVFRLEDLVLPHSKVPTIRHVRILQPILRKHFASEVGGLYLLPKFRSGGLGRLLSLSRFLFIAAFPERFYGTIIAEMRGRIEKNRESPFYSAVGEHFIKLPFVRLLATLAHDRSFIPQVMPRLPIYVNLLPLAAQRAIGKTHKNTKAALNLLLNEGFQPTGEVDIFVAGPKLAAQTTQIRTITNSRSAVVRHLIAGSFDGSKAMISNQNINFAVAYASIQIDENDGSVTLSHDAANTLLISKGDEIRYVLAQPKQKP